MSPKHMKTWNIYICIYTTEQVGVFHFQRFSPLATSPLSAVCMFSPFRLQAASKFHPRFQLGRSSVI